MNFPSEEIEKIIGYTFFDEKLLKQAFTHSSFANEHNTTSYERLEFVGDSILGYIVALELYRIFPNEEEGKLTKMRAEIVSRECLAKTVDEAGLCGYIRCGNGQDNVRFSENVKCNLFESILGGILIDNDGNMEKAKAYVMTFLGDYIKNAVARERCGDSKSKLLEICAKAKKKCEFLLVSKSDTVPTIFSVKLLLDGEEKALADGPTKKEAEKNAAKAYLENL